MVGTKYQLSGISLDLSPCESLVGEDVSKLRLVGLHLGCSRKLGSLVNGSMGYFTYTYKWGMSWDYNNPLILSIDPNFQHDIQAVLLLVLFFHFEVR